MNLKAAASIALAAVVVCTAVLAGCKKSDDSSAANGAQGFGNGSGFKQADLTGEVTAISGNKITLKLIQMPTMNRGTGSGSGRWNGSRPSGSWPSGSRPDFASGSRPAGGYFGGRSGVSGFRRTMTRKIEYTGKAETVTIPSTATVYIRMSTSSGSKELNLNVASIKKGEILSIYYAADKKTIQKVAVSIKTSSDTMEIEGGMGGGTRGGMNGRSGAPDGNMPNAQGGGAPDGNGQGTTN